MSAARAESWNVNDAADLRDVYEATFDEVARYATRLAGPDVQLAEDLVHDVFVDLARRVRAEPIEVSMGWFVTAVRHRFIDHVREQSRRKSTAQRLGNGSTTNSVWEDDDTDMLAVLSPLDRLALAMHHVDGCTVSEVAVTIGRSKRATESLLARARARVRRTHEEREQ
jgi:RNA polymerase sigma-70 factor, ECF subfamily